MAHGRISITIIFLLVVVSGCGNFFTAHKSTDRAIKMGTEKQVINERQIFRGYATFGHEARTFRLCGTDDQLWAIEPSGLLWELCRELAPPDKPYKEIFAVVEAKTSSAPADGFGAEYPGTLHIDRILYAANEGFGCTTDWERFRYRAMGNEPFWNLEISSRGIVFKRLGEPDLVWKKEDVIERNFDEELHFRGRAVSDLPEIEIIITPEPCRDTMSGAWSAFSATARVGTREYKGYAIKGFEK